MNARTAVLALGLPLATAVLATPAAAQKSIALLAPEAGDLVSGALTTALPPARPDVAREPVSFSWPLSPDRPLEARPAPPVQRSKEYWFQATAADLGRGVALPTTAPGALVRVSPAPRSPGSAPGSPRSVMALDPGRLELSDAKGRAYSAAEALELRASAAQLEAAGSPFPKGTAAFRLRSELGAGRFVLRALDLAASTEDRYVVHVLDQQSDLELALRSGRGAYLQGDRLTVTTELARGGRNLDLQEVSGHLVAPTGEAWPVQFKRTASGAWQAGVPLAGAAPPGGLWEVEVFARAEDDGQTVLRGVRTAFAVAAPSARLTGVALPGKAGPAVALEVEAAAPGRYEVRGILYGTDARGELKPTAVAHSAAWLEAGRGQLQLTFDPGAAAAAGLRAPFEVRDLQLLDQGRLGLLHRQARGLVLP